MGTWDLPPQAAVLVDYTVGEEVITVDFSESVVTKCAFFENFRGKGEGHLVQALRVPRLRMEDLSLFRNGDIAIIEQVAEPASFWKKYSGIHQQTLSSAPMLSLSSFPEGLSDSLV